MHRRPVDSGGDRHGVSGGGRINRRMEDDLSTRRPACSLPRALEQRRCCWPVRCLPLPKAVNCAVKSKDRRDIHHDVHSLRGQLGIHDGVVATLRLTIASNAGPGSFRIRTGEALAVYRDLKRVAMDPAETTVKIRPK